MKLRSSWMLGCWRRSAELELRKNLKTIIPLPPLADQEHIVLRIDEMFAICELLKDKILKAQEAEVGLSKTIVENIVA